MEQNTTESLLCEHLMNIEVEAVTVLGRFEGIGQKIDETFINQIVKETVDRFKQTCELYYAPLKLKEVPSATTTMITTTTIDTTAVVVETDTVNKNEFKRKSEIIDNNMHKVKKQKFIEFNSNDTAVNKDKFKYTDFFCVYCYDSHKSFYNTIDDVYEHWLDNHVNESISVPFKFYAIPVVNCFHCNEIGTYHNLVKHHKDRHEDEQFAIVEQMNFKECAICHVIDTDLLTHFKLQHDLHSTPKVYNPIYYSEEMIFDLLTIDVQSQCEKCNEFLHSDVEASDVLHDCKVNKSKGDYLHFPAYLICDYCHEEVNWDSFLDHFQNHTYEFHCSQCPYQSDDISELIFHELSIHKIDSLNYHCSIFPGWIRNKFFNTDMVFSNGLTLKMYNVHDTKFDDSKSFDKFLKKFLDTKKERVQKMIGLNELNENSNDSPQSLSGNSSGDISPNPSTTSEPKFVPPSVNVQLMEQRKLARNVFVHGITNDLKIQNLYETFMKLCRKLRLSITRGSIEDIVQCKDGLIVKFYRMNTKKMVVSRTSGLFCWAEELFGATWTRYHKSRKLYIRNHMTPFYNNLYAVASGLKRQNTLYSHKMSEHGLMVKRMQHCKEQIIDSEKQLLEYVRD